MRNVPCGGESAEEAPFRKSTVDRFEARAHDDETSGHDADVHFDRGDGQAGDICPW